MSQIPWVKTQLWLG